MLVGVTGGTGFLGAHTIAALGQAGHEVRLLVREPSRVGRALRPLGVEPSRVQTVVVDLTDPDDVARGIGGVDAVIHLAAVYSFNRRSRHAIRRTNERVADVVLGEAVRAGADPVVHVSSVAALFPAAGGGPVSEQSPVGRARETYLASKAAAERIARRHQAAGAPVVITYPAGLIGPDDPGPGDQNERLRSVLRGLTPIWPLGGFPLGDVRDTARFHAALISADPRPARAFGPGRHVTTREFVDAARTVTGRVLPAVFVPPRALLPFGVLADTLQRFVPWPLPVEYGAIYACAVSVPFTATDRPTAIQPRPITDSVRDTISWLQRTGRVSERQAGSALTAPALPMEVQR
jgi:dihydroflavonol-4-reductase